MSDLEGLEQVSEQTSFRVNDRSRRGKFGWGVSPNIERASVRREAKQVFPDRETATTAEKVPKKPPRPVPQPSANVARMIGSYDDLITAFRERVDGFNISRHELDFLAGLAIGHSGKLLGHRQVKRFGSVTLGPILGALGLKLILIEDPEQTAKILKRARPRDSRQVRYKSED